MQTPELLLTQLNQALRELRGASRALDLPEIDAQLLPILRRLTLAEIMSTRWMIAVGGTQGAGKTTLIRTLYDLTDDDPWLPANEGRGETLPVLLEECSQINSPQGYALQLQPAADGSARFEIVRLALTASEFVQACRGQRVEVLLPILQVPARHFRHAGQSLLLLPGYEKRSTSNQIWQDLMRQALVGAAGCVIVTDATRLANKDQQDIVKDMLANELRTVQPLVVITKTEACAGRQDKLDELRQSAVTALALHHEGALQGVICAGQDQPGSTSDYVGQWRPAVAAALAGMSLNGSATRQVQLQQLEQTLAVELVAVLREIRTQAMLALRQAGNEDGNQQTIRNCLEAFDDANEQLREQHLEMVRKLTAQHYATAWQGMEQRLLDQHEGFRNKLGSTFDTVTETQRKLEQNVLASWQQVTPLLDQYAGGLAQLTARSAGPRTVASTLPATAAPLQRLGYVDVHQQAVKARFTEEKTHSNLRALLCSRAGVQENTAADEDLERSARLLPVLVLEYTRIASVLPQLVQIDGATLSQMPAGNLAGSIDRMQQQLSQFGDTSRSLLKGIAAIMAVDVAADGHADILNALLASVGIGSAQTAASTAASAAAMSAGAGTVAAGTNAAGGSAAAAVGMTVGGAVAATVAIGYLAHCALQEVKRYDGQVRNLAQSMLLNISDKHQAHFQARYDELMTTMRSQLQQGLRSRYGMDRALMEQDRLQKALADVRVLQQDLLSQLASSGQTLALFDTATT